MFFFEYSRLPSFYLLRLVHFIFLISICIVLFCMSSLAFLKVYFFLWFFFRLSIVCVWSYFHTYLWLIIDVRGRWPILGHLSPSRVSHSRSSSLRHTSKWVCPLLRGTRELLSLFSWLLSLNWACYWPQSIIGHRLSHHYLSEGLRYLVFSLRDLLFPFGSHVLCEHSFCHS